jgi:PqqD family protein of HPr-rel-A system
MGDGLILFDHGSNLVHHLNPSAGIVWHLADGSATVEELARDIARELGGDEQEVRYQVASLIAELEALGVVENIKAEAAGVQPPTRGGT